MKGVKDLYRVIWGCMTGMYRAKGIGALRYNLDSLQDPSALHSQTQTLIPQNPTQNPKAHVNAAMCNPASRMVGVWTQSMVFRP